MCDMLCDCNYGTMCVICCVIVIMVPCVWYVVWLYSWYHVCDMLCDMWCDCNHDRCCNLWYWVIIVSSIINRWYIFYQQTLCLLVACSPSFNSTQFSLSQWINYVTSWDNSPKINMSSNIIFFYLLNPPTTKKTQQI